jgi:hypothetical protein
LRGPENPQKPDWADPLKIYTFGFIFLYIRFLRLYDFRKVVEPRTRTHWPVVIFNVLNELTIGTTFGSEVLYAVRFVKDVLNDFASENE